MIASALEQKVAGLELKLAEAFERITQLERQIPPVPVGGNSEVAEERQLLPLDSPEMAYALQLASEVFPGSKTEVEVEYDPAEPHWKWYSFNIQWQGETRDSIDKQLDWHSQLHASFPNVGDQFRICVFLQ